MGPGPSKALSLSAAKPKGCPEPATCLVVQCIVPLQARTRREGDNEEKQNASTTTNSRHRCNSAGSRAQTCKSSWNPPIARVDGSRNAPLSKSFGNRRLSKESEPSINSADPRIDAVPLYSSHRSRGEVESPVHKVTLYTSVPLQLIRETKSEDYGVSYQKECINSWREAGFKIVSLNPDCEIDALLRKGYDIEFISNGDSRNRTKIGTFLSTILNSGESIAGIINADCFLMSPGMAISNILKAADGSIILLERLDIDPKTMRATGTYSLGFDAFFFDTRFVENIVDGDNWTIGDPAWDYWFPLVMHIAGARLKVPNAPIIVHLNHVQQWRGVDSRASGSKLLRDLLSSDLEGRLPVELAQQVRRFNFEGQPGPIDDGSSWEECIIPWLKTFPERFSLCPSGSSGDFVCRILAGMAGSKEFQLEHQLSTVTLGYWIQAKRRAFFRAKTAALDRINSLLLSWTSRAG